MIAEDRKQGLAPPSTKSPSRWLAEAAGHNQHEHANAIGTPSQLRACPLIGFAQREIPYEFMIVMDLNPS
jgi:hypothetical protein